MLRNLLRKWIPALGAALLACLPAAPTTLVRMNLGQLTKAAEVVVRAKCLETQSQWQGGEIWTLSRFGTIETYKGQAPAQFTVRLLGGRVGAVESVVGGVPRFRAGERVVLFLDAARGGGYSVTAWSEGTFRVDENSAGKKYLTQATAAQFLYDPATGKFEDSGARRIPLAIFRLLIRKFTGRGPKPAPGGTPDGGSEGRR
jgi:hypothetical protein